MLQHTSEMTAVSLLMQAAPLTVAEIAEIDYSPVLLLDAKFDVAVTDDPAFRSACEYGFDAYFEDMCEWNESGTETVLVERCSTWAEIVRWVVSNALTEERPGRLLSRGWRAGFGLGWLSALALTRRGEAVRALAVLEAMLTPSEGVLRLDVAA
jgi:hypothetical protein